MIGLTVLAWLAVTAGLYMLLFTAANILYLKITSRRLFTVDGPMVSVLIPARNEANRIGPALEGLRCQSYGNYEVIVLDDNSDDGTMELIRRAADGDPRFTAMKGADLPEGWKGKPYAMQQLAASARGEILLFIDADMTPGPNLVAWTVANMNYHGVDFLSGYPMHTSPEPAEYFLFPVMYLATSFLLPLWLFRTVKSYMFSHAIGQFFCIRASVLRSVGGFEPVKDKINEDIQMARKLKGEGFRQVFLDAKDHISGNMYDSMAHAKMGIMRVVYEYFDNLVYPFFFMGLVMVALLLAPIPLAIAGFAAGAEWAPVMAVGVALVFTAWLVTMIDRRMPWFIAFLYPVHFTWTLLLSIRSIILSRKGKGYQWKGRTVR